MITTRQARRALKFTNQLVAPVAREGKGWIFQRWDMKAQDWVIDRPASSYIDALRWRKVARLARATSDLAFSQSQTRELAKLVHGGARSESALARASHARATLHLNLAKAA